MPDAKQCNVGGQAVIEGVMMRSPRSFTVVCRRPTGDLAVREEKWCSLSERHRFLRWPFFRGAVVLLESLINGISALNFSARQQEEAQAKTEPSAEGSSSEKPSVKERAAFTGLFILSFAFALFIF
jgi:uncharacterized protein YqhQ